MQDKRKKVVNNRPMVFIALFLFMGITIGALFRDNALALFITFGILIALSVALFIFKKKALAKLIIISLLGVCIVMLALLNAHTTEYKGSQIVEGRVVASTKNTKGYLYAYQLKDAKIRGKDTDRQVLLYTNTYLAYGDIVWANGDIDSFNYQPFDSYSMSYYYRSINHILKADEAHVIAHKRPNVLTRLYLKIRDNYMTYMGGSAGGIAISLVFGDTSMLDRHVENNIRNSGLSHIFSVSGLHVAFMAGAVFFVCNKLKLRRSLSLLVVTAMIFLYGFLTGFPASMIRAMVMLLVMFVAQLTLKRYDALSGLALAGIIIVLFKPLSLFELGFQMSVSAMLGIICFYNPIKRMLYNRKNKILNFLASSVAMSISAMSIMIAIVLNTFSSFGLYFCLGNLIIIPFVAFSYALLMLITLITLIFPFLSVLFVVPKFLFLAMAEITAGISSLPYSTVATNKLGVFATIYAITIIFMSKFVMIDKKYKYRALAVISSLSLVLYIAL